jgi:valyl-tRNA synthetase
MLLAEHLNRFYSHRSVSTDGKKDPIILWIGSETNSLRELIEGSGSEFDYHAIISAIYNILDQLNHLVFPLLKGAANNDRGTNQNEMSIILHNIIYLIKPFLPYIAEKMFQIIYEDKLITADEYNLNYITIRACPQDTKNKVENLINLITEVETIRKNHNVPSYQGLYADFSYIKEDSIFIKYLQTSLNLVPKSLTNVEGQVEKVIFQDNHIIIDMVLDNNLITIACQKEMSKIISNWKTTHRFKSKQNVKILITHTGFQDTKVLNKLKLNTFWPELQAETIWSDDQIDKDTTNSYHLLDIAEINLRLI